MSQSQGATAVDSNDARRPETGAPARKKQRTELMSLFTPDALATSIVGGDANKTRFTVTRDVACFHSPVFHAAFKGKFVESQSLEYRLEQVNEATGKMLVQWLKFGTFEVVQLADGFKLTDDNEKVATQEDCNLVTLWALADELGIPQIQNHVLTKLHKVQGDVGLIGNRAIEKLYQFTNSESVLRKYFIAYSFAALSQNHIRERSSSRRTIPHEFLVDYAIVMATWAQEVIREGFGERPDFDETEYLVKA